MYLSESLVVEAVCVFFLLGWGILHSIWKATQFVQGMPSEAASQRTFLLFGVECQYHLHGTYASETLAAASLCGVALGSARSHLDPEPRLSGSDGLPVSGDASMIGE